MKFEIGEIVDALNFMSEKKKGKTLADRMREDEAKSFEEREVIESCGPDCDTCKDYNKTSSDDLTILGEAYDIVEGQRRTDYGDISASFERIAGMWSAYLGCNLDGYDVANMMIMLKLSRAHGKGFQRDSFVDVCGYAYCAEKLSENDDGMFCDD